MTYRAKDHYKSTSVADRYDVRRFRSIKGRLVDWRERHLIVSSLHNAGVGPGAEVLDIPSGTGRVAVQLAAAGFVVTGADISDAMLDRARERTAALPADARPSFVVADAEQLPFTDGAFSSAVSLRLFGHLPPDVRARVLLELRRVAPTLVVAYYDSASLQGRLRRRSRSGTPWYPVARRTIDVELAAAGLRRVRQRSLLRFVSETVVVTAVRA